MEENKLYLTGLCPFCSASLDYLEDALAVKCHSCGNAVSTRNLLLPNSKDDADVKFDNDRKIAEGVVSAEAGLVYFDNFCENFDWNEFAENPKLSISIFDAIAEVCKLKFSADPLTYIFDFRRQALPVLKKIECLDLLEVSIIENYRGNDPTDAFEHFYLYSAITRAICDKHDAIYEGLIFDIRMAIKFGAEEEVIADLKESLLQFEKIVSSVKPVSDISELESIKQLKAAKDEKIAEELRLAGIDPDKSYAKATNFLATDELDGAMHIFGALKGYKDSKEIIKNNSKTFCFNDQLIEMAGKRYVMRIRANPTFDLSNPAKEGVSYEKSLYEVVDGIPSRIPALSHITDIIGCYGTKIFFVRNDDSICCYETKSKEIYANVKVLDEAPRGDYVIDEYHPIRFTKDGSRFFLCKKLRDAEKKRGCFLRRKKNQPAPNRQNNYVVVLIDMDRNKSRILLPEIVDVMDFFDDKIFYTKMPTTNSTENEAFFRVYDLNCDKDDSILDEECVIHNVSRGRIIYSLWSPNMYNMDIYSIDMETKTPKLIEKNIRNYYATSEDKVFYTVGSDAYNRLYSADLDGANKAEIMENAGRIWKLHSGWIYYISGEGRNACLMKVSTDGKRQMRIASRISNHPIKMARGYIYYINTSNELHMTRYDGTCDRKIADNIVPGANIVIDNKGVYCLRNEFVGSKSGNEDGQGYSLYSIDLEGKNMKKLAFDVVAMTDYDENTLYICKKRTATYTVSTPISKKDRRSETVTREITAYCATNKETGDTETLLTLGAPDKRSYEFKTGCFIFRRKISKETVVIETTPRERYTRLGKSAAGMVYEEEQAQKRAEEERILAEKEAKKEEKRARKAEKKAEKQAKKEAKLAKKAAKNNPPEDMPSHDGSDKAPVEYSPENAE